MLHAKITYIISSPLALRTSWINISVFQYNQQCWHSTATSPPLTLAVFNVCGSLSETGSGNKSPLTGFELEVDRFQFLDFDKITILSSSIIATLGLEKGWNNGFQDPEINSLTQTRDPLLPSDCEGRDHY